MQSSIGCKNSTIFKTYKNDLDGISNKLGFSKRSFAEWGAQVATTFKESKGFVDTFKNTLKTMFTVQSENSNNWLKNKAGDIISKDNINSLIPELTKENASILLKSIQDEAIAVSENKRSWESYFTLLENQGHGAIVDLIKNTDDLSKLTGEDLVKANQQAREAAIAHNTALQQQTLGAKAATVALNGLKLAGNMLAMWAIGKAISFVKDTIDNYVHRLEYAVDAMEEANSSFESLESEVESLNDELETCRDRIKELQALSDAGTISITEQEELDRLKEENAELERNLRLQQEKARLAAIEAADAATSTLTTTVQSSYKTRSTFDSFSGAYIDEESLYVTPTEELHEAIEAYYELENAVNDLKESYDANEISSEEYEKQSASLTDQQIEARTRMSEMYDIVDEGITSYKNLTDHGIELDKEQQGLYQSAINVSNEYDDLIKDLDKTTTATDNLTESQEKLSTSSVSISDIFALEDAEGATTALGELNDQLDAIQSAYKSLSDAMETYNDTGYITIDQLQSIIEQGGQFLDYLVDENGSLSMDEQALYNLAAARLYEMKCKVQSNVIDTVTAIQDEDAAAAYLTSTNYGLADSYTALTTAKLTAWKTDMLSSGDISDSTVNTVYDKAVADIQKVEDLFSKVNVSSLGGAAVSSSGSGSSSSTETDYKNLLDGEIDLLEAQLDAGYSSFKDYVQKRTCLIGDYYEKGLISASDYYSELEDMYKKQIEIYDQVLKAVSDRYDEEIRRIQEAINDMEAQNDALEEQKSLMESAADAVTSYIESFIQGENDIIDALNDANDGIEDQIDKYDSLVHAADRLYESQQERLKTEQDALQDKIDLLNDENDALDLQYRKEQALRELQRSQKQRTRLVYTGNDGYVYQADEAAVANAQKNLKDIETEELIASLENEQSALQDAIDALQQYRDALSDISDAYNHLAEERNAIELLGEDYQNIILGTSIDDWLILKDKYIEANNQMAANDALIASHEEKIALWESEKDNWSSLTGIIEDEANKQAAIELFGADWEAQINEGRLTAFEEFKLSYLDIQNQIDDNTSLIESYEEKITYYEGLKDQWASIADEYEKEQNRLMAAELLGKDWEKDLLEGRQTTLSSFAGKYISAQRDMTNAAVANRDAIVKANNDIVESNRAAANGSLFTPSKEPEPDTLELLNASYCKETKQNLPLAGGGGNFMTLLANGGLITDRDRSPLDSLVEPYGEDHVVGVRNGERVLTKAENLLWENRFRPEEMLDKLSGQNLFSWNIPNFNEAVMKPSMTAIPDDRQSTVIYGGVHMTLPNVTDANSFARDIKLLWPNIVRQEGSKR